MRRQPYDVFSIFDPRLSISNGEYRTNCQSSSYNWFHLVIQSINMSPSFEVGL
ncbi:MAG: hypothetical protein RIR53_341 [Bacteroidota bacterium]